MRFFKYLSLALVTFVNACSYPVKIHAWNEFQGVPTPVFTAYDPDKADQRPVYTSIKVYEEKGSCEVPYCPLMWHVEVSKFQSPTHIVYGGFPGLGSSTIQSAYPLNKEGHYSLVVSEEGFNGSDSVQGYLPFEITNEGKIREKEMKD
ncbi:MAG: hypothetical protein IT291_01555 [Deltaproteobacteria bacterium]|nr:hypothetical protein [Deltaproteobacteria bacterium]